MDLWIRSQDKTILSSIRFVNYSTLTLDRKEGEFYHREGHYLESGGMLLGEYKTKERALEVLDEIQNYLTPRFIVSTASDNDCIENLFDKQTSYKAFPDDKLVIKNIARDCWVYEMPKE